MSSTEKIDYRSRVSVPGGTQTKLDMALSNLHLLTLCSAGMLNCTEVPFNIRLVDIMTTPPDLEVEPPAACDKMA